MDRTSELVPLTGNTYPIRGLLSSMGAVWDNEQKRWLIDKENFSKAQELILNEAKEAKERRKETERSTPIEVHEATAIRSLCWIHTKLIERKGWYGSGEKKVEKARLAIQRLGGDTLWINQALAFLLLERKKYRAKKKGSDKPSDTIVKRIDRHKIEADDSFLKLLDQAQKILNDYYGQWETDDDEI
ncbi:MAG: hypothetical protein ACOH5I_26530 [Oligoflexus sp.]